jgi:hypothetical protein
MKLPNWFRIAWWLVLCAGVSYLVISRMPDMTAGRANAADVAFLVLWLTLVLVPVFSEMKIGSVLELKQHIESAKEDVKHDVRGELAELRMELRNAVDVRTNISPQINFPAPARDDQLPRVEETIRRVLADVLGPRKDAPEAVSLALGVSEDVRLLFETRYGIEVALKRIAGAYGVDSDGRRPIAGLRLANLLSQQSALPQTLLGPIREVYAVCSPAIHGEPVTKAQVDFVREVGPSLIQALELLSNRLVASTTSVG